MNMKKAIAVFDIGKTNKKFLLFGEDYEILLEEEIKFAEIADDDGFPCDDIEKIETWITVTLKKILNDNNYEITALNFSTYGATLVYIDGEGKRCAPVYNYLKPMPDDIKSRFIRDYNNDGDFFRKTASPDLGLLNSGLQAYWLKYSKPELFKNVKHILHFPQYISYLLTGKIVTEHTSIGCHTAMWDFDNSVYHTWLQNEGITLPPPVPDNTIIESNLFGKSIRTGIGIHDSSASLVPYLKTGEEFILLSSGTWCINMNPFNPEPLTKEELDKDCLCYLSTNQMQVKSSRLFMGHYHDVNLKRVEEHFKAPAGSYKQVKPDSVKLIKWMKEKKNIFFNTPLPPEGIDYSVDLNKFASFEEAYNRLMFDLTMMEIEALNLVIPKRDNSKNIYISGGFSNNEIFVKLIATHFCQKDVFISEVANSSAVGAAMITGIFKNEVDLGFVKVEKLA
jgi:sugar (pentulose or hexulose) kinase